jgi:hypothetical protein
MKKNKLVKILPKLEEELWHDQKIDVLSQVQECRSNK